MPFCVEFLIVETGQVSTRRKWKMRIEYIHKEDVFRMSELANKIP